MRSAALFVMLLAASAAAQDPNTVLRDAIRAASRLDVERITINVDPAVRLTGISAVAADTTGNIYVLHRPDAGDPVVVLDRNGRLLRSWGRGMFEIPHGIRIDPAGAVWVTESSKSSKVYKFSNRGETLLEIDLNRFRPINDPGPRAANSPQVGATDVAFGPEGSIYVSDGYANARVIVFDARGRFIREWGAPGVEPGQFRIPHAIAFGPDGHVYVADRENGRVQWFDTTGTVKGQWRFGGQVFSIAFGPTGDAWVSTHPSDVPLDDEFHVVRLDRSTGRMLGAIEVRAHELSIAADGAVLPATRSSAVVLFRMRSFN